MRSLELSYKEGHKPRCEVLINIGYLGLMSRSRRNGIEDTSIRRGV